ncbi:SRPBCC family protein [Paenibacillus sp. GCM10027627]|uniref:SRPBCC family protein n=1 Tax=unclassified Paenibacillus TaxID=185978 RepID=UPI00362F24BB
MLAVITETETGYAARFERHFHHSVEKVWAVLTDNAKLKQWFPELHIDELRKGGVIKFDMGGGTFEELAIVEVSNYSILEYTWGEDRVRFELYPELNGCLLFLHETIHRMTDHTPRDLAGWHVCLNVIEALLNERTLEKHEREWDKWYKEYAKLTEKWKS